MARSNAVAAGTGDVQAVTGSGTLVEYSVRETTGSAAAALTVRDGTSAAGAALAVIALPSSGSGVEILPAVGFTAGLFVDRSAGSSEIILYVA